jgi:hypothetical protein
LGIIHHGQESLICDCKKAGLFAINIMLMWCGALQGHEGIRHLYSVTDDNEQLKVELRRARKKYFMQ